MSQARERTIARMVRETVDNVRCYNHNKARCKVCSCQKCGWPIEPHGMSCTNCGHGPDARKPAPPVST